MNRNLVMSVLLCGMLAACASSKSKAPVVDGSATGGASTASTTGSGTADASRLGNRPGMDSSALGNDPLNDPNGQLAGRSVFYPVDVDAVQAADKPLIAAHAQYLASHPQRKVRVEGNCDERGSTEYNLALGQRRAEGVKKLLQLGGAKDAQIAASSFGEEKPRCTAHDESCWSQNRRSDLNYGK
jgi:peptidoglycan-associated lipoprotein